MPADPSRPRPPSRRRPAPAPPPPPCPACRSPRVIPIVYGLPTPEDLHADMVEGRLELAGCVIPEAAPAWRCRDCGEGFGDAVGAPRAGR